MDTTDTELLVAAARKRAVRFDHTRLVVLTGESHRSVSRALAGECPRALARIRVALGLAPSNDSTR